MNHRSVKHGAKQVAYDGVGNQTEVVWPAGTSGTGSYSVIYKYDAMNRMQYVNEGGTNNRWRSTVGTRSRAHSRLPTGTAPAGCPILFTVSSWKGWESADLDDRKRASDIVASPGAPGLDLQTWNSSTIDRQDRVSPIGFLLRGAREMGVPRHQNRDMWHPILLIQIWATRRFRTHSKSSCFSRGLGTSLLQTD